MEDTLISALETMLTLQRWNFLPRVEDWVEAENASMVTHLGYAIARRQGMTNEQLSCLLIRSLFKSLNKHYMTDISLKVREKLRQKDINAWSSLVDHMASKTSELFPRKIAPKFRCFLTDKPLYAIDSRNSEKDIERIESLVRYCQLKVAYAECSINAHSYPDEYATILKDLEKRLNEQNDSSENNKILNEHQEYFLTIRRLKYLRRWNRINRIVSSSVLGHTYLVAVLAVMFSHLSEEEHDKDGPFLHQTILRALFHDMAEGLTGDIITPVKKQISKHSPSLIDDVEKELSLEFIAQAPIGVRDDIKQYGLLDELSTKDLYSVSSLVKDCDRLALVVECICEKSSGITTQEIEKAYFSAHQELSKSEWTCIREFMNIVTDHWHNK